MPSPRQTQTTDLYGTVRGTDFDDKTVIRDINTAEISRIVVTYDTCLRSITVHYRDAVGVARGTAVSSNAELTLLPGEFITMVEGTTSAQVISKIEFVTSKGRRWGPFGQVMQPTTGTGFGRAAQSTTGGLFGHVSQPTAGGLFGQQAQPTTFIWSGFGPGMGLLYFSGTADTHIRTLRGTFGMYLNRVEHPKEVKYEKYVTSEAATQSTVPRSKFAMVLMSQTVTLLVGADKTILNVSQEILCRLPFFRAALQGNFREASEQTINMPEDEPQDVTALVEFLYTGSYTYPYHVDAESEPDSPAPGLAEGLYHVGVYATAHKYGCLELVAASLGLFMYVLGHLKGIDVVQLWKGAYAKNLLLQEIEDEKKSVEFRHGLAELLKELYMEHRLEMETAAAEYPILVSDLLRLVVTL